MMSAARRRSRADGPTEAVPNTTRERPYEEIPVDRRCARPWSHSPARQRADHDRRRRPAHRPQRSLRRAAAEGREQAVEDINAAGGINGEQIKLVVGDDVSDPKQGISVANKFVGDGVKFVVGHFNSGVSIPASEVYRERLLEITPAATNPKFTERGLWNTFRTCGRDDQQGASPAAISPTTSRTPRSRSSMTRPRTARAWPTRPRRP